MKGVPFDKKGARFRLGDIFRLSNPPQPLTLPLDDAEADAELKAFPADAERGRKVRTGNLKGRPKKERPSAESLWAECKAEKAKVKRKMSATDACKIVAKRYDDLSWHHLLRLTRPFRR